MPIRSTALDSLFSSIPKWVRWVKTWITGVDPVTQYSLKTAINDILYGKEETVANVFRYGLRSVWRVRVPAHERFLYGIFRAYPGTPDVAINRAPNFLHRFYLYLFGYRFYGPFLRDCAQVKEWGKWNNGVCFSRKYFRVNPSAFDKILINNNHA